MKDRMELLDDIASLRAELSRITAGWKCSCGATYSPEIALQACDHSHRETWPHEWIVPAERELRETILGLRAELAARPVVLPDEVRGFITRAVHGDEQWMRDADELLTKYAAGVPQGVAAELASQHGEPVAWAGVSRVIADLQRIDMQLGDSPYRHSLHAAANWIDEHAVEPPAPFRVEDLPGYLCHNTDTSVFGSRAGSKVAIVELVGTTWGWKVAPSEMWIVRDANKELMTREAAERAASAWVTSSNDGGGGVSDDIRAAAERLRDDVAEGIDEMLVAEAYLELTDPTPVDAAWLESVLGPQLACDDEGDCTGDGWIIYIQQPLLYFDSNEYDLTGRTRADVLGLLRWLRFTLKEQAT